MVFEGGATVVSVGTMLVAASAVAPVALIIYHPEALLTGASAAQMDLAVERQIRQNANAPAPPTPAAALRPDPGGWTTAFRVRVIKIGNREKIDIGMNYYKNKLSILIRQQMNCFLLAKIRRKCTAIENQKYQEAFGKKPN